MEMITIPEETSLDVFTADKGLEPYLQKVREEIDRFKPDTSNAKGRAAIRTFAAKVTKSKTALDKVGKELVAELKQKPKLIDAERKRMRDQLDIWKKEVRQPLDEWEAEQEAIKQSKEMEAAHVEALGMNDIFDREREIERKEAEIKAREDAERAQREQAERDARLQQEAADKARKDAEEKAAREKAEAEKAVAEQKLAAERAEKEKREAIEKAEREKREAMEKAEYEKNYAIQKEKDAAANREHLRLEAEKQAKAEQAAREADHEHRRTINNQAVEALEAAAIPKSVCQRIVTMIAKGEVSNIKINY